ncbi:hypothetical protein RM6536_0199 [Rothia mucilaginosa]|uniref:Uncharacterized protein n=1 Tax=Rothia mucilaginosa TaxID=43675 RepID=A0A0K2RX51_9MICC|nr:hypothetical protein RM6536_0199 [Rothia mucilaginosa]
MPRGALDGPRSRNIYLLFYSPRRVMLAPVAASGAAELVV